MARLGRNGRLLGMWPRFVLRPGHQTGSDPAVARKATGDGGPEQTRPNTAPNPSLGLAPRRSRETGRLTTRAARPIQVETGEGHVGPTWGRRPLSTGTGKRPEGRFLRSPVDSNTTNPSRPGTGSLRLAGGGVKGHVAFQVIESPVGDMTDNEPGEVKPSSGAEQIGRAHV